MHLDRLVAFARRLLHSFKVENVNVPAPIANETGPLECVGNHGHTGAPDTHHFGNELLREQKFVAALQIPAAQEPARKTRFDGVGCVACGGLLRLHENELLMSEERGTYGRA